MQAETRENEKIKQSWSVIHPLSREDSGVMTTLGSAVAAMKGKLEGALPAVRLTASWNMARLPMASASSQIRSEAYPAGGPNRYGLGKAPRSSICMAVGSIGEQPRHSVISLAT